MIAFAIEDTQVLHDLRFDRQWEYWNKRGRGEKKERESYKAARLHVETLATEAKGDAPPFMGPVQMRVRGEWPPHDGCPEESAAWVMPGIGEALRMAHVITTMTHIVSATVFTTIGKAARVEVEIVEWDTEKGHRK